MPYSKDEVLTRLDFRSYYEGELGQLGRKGNRWFALCPFHADTHPSLSVDLETGLWKCFGCGASGDIFGFHMQKYKSDFREALKALGLRSGAPENTESAKSKDKKFISLTLTEFSRAKKLPAEFLAKEGVREYHTQYGTTCILFPYLDGKKKLFCTRQRYGGKAKDEVKFLWPKGTKVCLYGLWRLREFRDQGWLLIVEGESDSLTAWYHGIPAVGMPGKENCATLRHRSLAGFQEIYLWEEPDAAVRPPGQPGMKLFREKVAEIIPQVRVIRAPAGYKDISEAHIAGVELGSWLEELKWGAELVEPPEPPPLVSGEFSLSDLGNARRLVARHGRDLLYSYKAKKWLVWNGRFWEWDYSGEVERRAKQSVAQTYEEAGRIGEEERRQVLAKFALRSEAKERITAMIKLAQSEPGIPVQPEELDAHEWLLNCSNGTVDLRTGELGLHRREDKITCMVQTPYKPEADVELWERFLYRIQDNNVEKIFFLQQALGYTLTGNTREECLFIFWGGGANGKSTLIETISHILGAYALNTPVETLLQKTKSGDIPSDVARLAGPRLVTASETDRGRRLAESLIKALTGRDTVTARYLYGEFFDFVPQFKLFLSTNHKPVIRGVDDAIWRRIHFIDFPVQIPEAERDKELRNKLIGEAAGILAWMVRGCLDWYKHGLLIPKDVRQATLAYRSEMDVLQDFLEDKCMIAAGAQVPAGELYEAYCSWAEENGIKEKERLKQRTFGLAMSERGFQPYKSTKGVRLRLGVGLLSIK